MTKHTATPWIIEADSVSNKLTQIKQGGIIVDGERERIATVNFASNKANAEANAAFIVKTGNCHSALVNSCKKALEFSLRHSDETESGNVYSTLYDALRHAGEV